MLQKTLKAIYENEKIKKVLKQASIFKCDLKEALRMLACFRNNDDFRGRISYKNCILTNKGREIRAYSNTLDFSYYCEERKKSVLGLLYVCNVLTFNGYEIIVDYEEKE